jgi:hypothetical protein
MSAPGRALICGAALAGASVLSHAQQGLPGMRSGPGIPGAPPMLQRIEQNVADVGPLSDTLRKMDFQIDLHSPTGFSNVYRVPGRPDLFMRSSGAVHAVFPQSVYVETERGLTPAVPAGTTFAIGMPSPWTLPPRQIQPTLQQPTATSAAGMTTIDRSMVSRRNTRMNTLVSETPPDDSPQDHAEVLLTESDIRLEQPALAQPPHPSTILRTIVTDEALRADRLVELLQHAAQAFRARGG